MSFAFELGLGLISCLVFFALIQRAFFSGKIKVESVAFTSTDLVVALILTGLFSYIALGLFSSKPEKAFNQEDILSSLIIQCVLGGGLLAYLGFRKLSIRRFFLAEEKPASKLIWLGVLLMCGLFPMIGVLGGLLHSDPSQEQEAVKFFRESTSLESRLSLAFMAVIVAPIVEEMIFRGLLYRIYQSYIGKMGAMLITSLLFAAIHLNLPSFVPLVVLAFAFTAALELHGSLIVNIAMHATFNAVSLLLMLGAS